MFLRLAARTTTNFGKEIYKCVTKQDSKLVTHFGANVTTKIFSRPAIMGLQYRRHSRELMLRRMTISNTKNQDPLASLVGGKSKFLKIDGDPEIILHYVQCGPDEGPLVVLLHGFPDFWWTWRNQLPALASEGFCAVALDMRGYHRSSKPADVKHYKISHLSDDVAHLICHLAPTDKPGPRKPVCLVGHDWGGIVAWAVAMRHAALLDRLAVLNAPHPNFFLNQVARGKVPWTQLLKSWYIAAFQVRTTSGPAERFAHDAAEPDGPPSPAPSPARPHLRDIAAALAGAGAGAGSGARDA